MKPKPMSIDEILNLAPDMIFKAGRIVDKAKRIYQRRATEVIVDALADLNGQKSNEQSRKAAIDFALASDPAVVAAKARLDFARRHLELWHNRQRAALALLAKEKREAAERKESQ
jgi:hypothetical protein